MPFAHRSAVTAHLQVAGRQPTAAVGRVGNQAALRRLATPIQRACAACEEEKSIQRRSSDGGEPDHVPEVVHQVLGAAGRPLDPAARAFMEPRFGQDFSAVRVHTGEQATAAARSINAQAFTSGASIVFADGAYSPQTRAGRQTLAHELTHVVQQNSGMARGAGVGPKNDVHERQADRVADTVAAGGRAQGLGGAGGPAARGAIQRIWDTGDEIDSGPGPSGLPPVEDPPPLQCPATHTMPDDLYTAVAEAWGKSHHGEDKIQEHGGRVVTDRKGVQQIRTGHGPLAKSGAMSLPRARFGDTTLGSFHTHPYTLAKGAPLGVGFSGADIENFVRHKQGDFKYVGAGSCNFALTTLSKSARDACKKTKIIARWDKAFKAAGGSFQSKVDSAVKTSIAGCGMCYYKACRPDAASPSPKAMDLV